MPAYNKIILPGSNLKQAQLNTSQFNRVSGELAAKAAKRENERIRRAEADRQLDQRLRPASLPKSVQDAGKAWSAIGNKPAAQLYKNKAIREFEQGERDRLAKVKSQYYGEQSAAEQSALSRTATAEQSRLGRVADMDKQQLIGRQQSNLQEMLGEQAAQQGRLSLQDTSNARAFKAFTEGRLSPKQASVAGTYRPEFGYRFDDMGPAQLLPQAKGRAVAKGGLPSAKDMFGIRKGLHGEFYGNTPTSRALKKKYGEDGFELFLREEMRKYKPAPPAQPGVLPVAPAQQDIPTQKLVQGTDGVWTNVPDPFAEQYAQSLLPQAPAQQIEQPTGRVQATLPPSPQDIDFDIPEEFTDADRPGRSKVGARPPAFDPEKSRALKLQPIKNLLLTDRLYKKPEPSDLMRLNVKKYNSKAGRKHIPQTKGQRLSSRDDKLKLIRDMFYFDEE